MTVATPTAPARSAAPGGQPLRVEKRIPYTYTIVAAALNAGLTGQFSFTVDSEADFEAQALTYSVDNSAGATQWATATLLVPVGLLVSLQTQDTRQYSNFPVPVPNIFRPATSDPWPLTHPWLLRKLTVVTANLQNVSTGNYNGIYLNFHGEKVFRSLQA